MTAWNKVRGDVSDTIIVILYGVESLTGAQSVEAHVWHETTRFTLVAEVLNSADRTVLVHLGGVSGWLATAETKVWNHEVEITFTDGSILTWPSGKPDTITVRA